MNIEEARGIAAQAWCTPECADKVLDPDLAEAFAHILIECVNSVSKPPEADDA